MRSQSNVTVMLMKRVHAVANVSVSSYAVNCRRPVSRRTKSTRCWSSVTWRCSSQRALHAGMIDRWFCVIRWDHQHDREGHRCDKMLLLWTIPSTSMSGSCVSVWNSCRAMTHAFTCDQVIEVWHFDARDDTWALKSHLDPLIKKLLWAEYNYVSWIRLEHFALHCHVCESRNLTVEKQYKLKYTVLCRTTLPSSGQIGSCTLWYTWKIHRACE